MGVESLSGLEEILQWAESQDLDDFESVAEEFDKDGRLPLEEILGNQLEEFRERLEGSDRKIFQGEDFQEEEEPMTDQFQQLLEDIQQTFLGTPIRSQSELVLPKDFQALQESPELQEESIQQGSLSSAIKEIVTSFINFFRGN